MFSFATSGLFVVPPFVCTFNCVRISVRKTLNGVENGSPGVGVTAAVARVNGKPRARIKRQ
jgi:hypothetical protein